MELTKTISDGDRTMRSYGALQETNRSRDKGQTDVCMAENTASADEMEVEMARIRRLREVLVRRESELRFMMDDMQLCKDIVKLKNELRALVVVSDGEKSKQQRQAEEKLIQEIQQLVQKRDFLVEDAEVERLREQEEDKEMAEFLRQKLSIMRAPRPRDADIPAGKPSIGLMVKDCCAATRCCVM